jgi:hypothetical protein
MRRDTYNGLVTLFWLTAFCGALLVMPSIIIFAWWWA